MNVLALTRYGQMGASSRLRFMQFQEPLTAFGIEVTVSPLLDDAYLRRLYAGAPTDWFAIMKSYAHRFRTLVFTRGVDLIWLEKELFPNVPGWLERLLRARGIPIVVDYDDAVFHTYDRGSLVKRTLLGKKIDAIMRDASIVVCGNQYLAARATSAHAADVELLPTVIDLRRYPIAPKPLQNTKVIGWIGSPATIKYLDVIAPALQKLAAEIAFELRIVGATYVLPGVKVVCREWKEHTEVREISDFDIGVMPLVDSSWERGKCGYKLIQYMACGKVVVASPVGVNTEIVRDDENGYLAASSDEWLSAMRSLLLDVALCNHLGRNGRERVEQHYCVQVATPRLAHIFERALVSKGSS